MADVTPRIPLQTPMYDDSGLMTRPWVLFFERFGKPGKDGEPGEAAVPPGDVAFVGAIATNTEPLFDDQGNEYLQVIVTYNPPKPIGSFIGVHAYVEAPDQYAIPGRPDPIIVDIGSQQYFGVETATDATRYGVIEYRFYPTKAEIWRFYLVSYSEFVENALVVRPDADASPNDAIPVVPGTSTAPVLPGDLIPIGGQPFLITVVVSEPDGNGLRRQLYTITYDPPPAPVFPFQGVAVDIQTPDQVTDGQAFAAGNQEYTGDPDALSGSVARRCTFELNLEFAQHAGEDWTFYLSPYSATYRVPLDANKGAYVGTTAHRSIKALSNAKGPAGTEWANQVTGLTVTVEYEYKPMIPGWLWRLNGAWINPDDTRFAGTKHVIRQFPAPTPDADSEDRIPSYFGPQDDDYTTDWFSLAEPQTWWDNFQPSIDILQRENTLYTGGTASPPNCPVVRVEVSEVLAIASLGLTRRDGEEYASHVTGVSAVVHQVWNDVKGLWTYYITCKWTNPDPAIDPRFGGLDLTYRADGTEDIVTPIFYEVDPGVPAGQQTIDLGLGDEWDVPLEDVPFTMFFRSFDWGGQANAILVGVTPSVDTVARKAPAVGLINNFTMRVEYGDNNAVLINDPTFTPPADPSFWYAELWMKNPRWTGQLSEMARSGELAIIGENFPPGPADETWHYWGVSVSYDLRKNPDPFDPSITSGSNYTFKLVGPAPPITPAQPPDDVEFIEVTKNATPLIDDQGNEYTLVTIRYNPPDPIGTFAGINVDVVAPDPGNIIVPIGDFDYFGDPNGTGAAREGVARLVFYPSKEETWRFYLSSFSPFVHNPLVLGVTPNKTLDVTAGSTATAPAAPDNVSIVSIEQTILTDGQGDGYINVRIIYNRPSPVGSFTGVDVNVEAPVFSNIIVPIGGFDYANHVDGNGHGVIDLTFYPTKHEDWLFYLSSYSVALQNPLDLATTPHILLTVEKAAVAAPVPPRNVTFVGQIQQVPKTDQQGNGYIEVTITYARPSPVGSFLGVDVDVEAPDTSNIIVPVGGFDYANNVDGSGNGVLKLVFYPANNETWRFYLSSYSALLHNPLVRQGAGASPSQTLTVQKAATAAAPQPPALPVLVTAAANIGSRQNAYSQLLECGVQFAPHPPAGWTADGIAVYLSRDDGATYDFVSNFIAYTFAITYVIWVDAPDKTISIARVKVIPFNTLYADIDQPTNSPAVSLPFTLSAAAAIPPNAITNAALAIPPGHTQAEISYTRQSDGSVTWGFRITWKNPTDVNFKATECKVQAVDAAGQPTPDYQGTLRQFDDRDGLGAQCEVTVGNDWTIYPASLGYKFRVTLWCVNQLMERTLQTSAWAAYPAHRDYLELIPVEPQQPPTLGEWAPHVTSPSAIVVPSTAESGALGYHWEGSLIGSTDASYAGCKVILQDDATKQNEELLDIQRGAPSAFRTSDVPLPSGTRLVVVYFVSYNVDGRQNAMGTSPHTPLIAIQSTPGAPGSEWAPKVTVQPGDVTATVDTYAENGGQEFTISGALTPPPAASFPNYKGCMVRACLTGGASVTKGQNTLGWAGGPAFSPMHVQQRIDVGNGTIVRVQAVIGPTLITMTAPWQGNTGAFVSAFIDELRDVADVGQLGTRFAGPRWSVQTSNETWRVLFISYDYASRENSLVVGPGGTPSVDVPVTRITGPAGQEFTPWITGVKAEIGAPFPTPDAVGLMNWIMAGEWTEPADIGRYGGTDVCRYNPADPNNSIIIHSVGKVAAGVVAKFRSDIQPVIPPAGGKLIFLSWDKGGRRNSFKAESSPGAKDGTPYLDFVQPAQLQTINLGYSDPATWVTASVAAGMPGIRIVTSLPSGSSTPPFPGSAYPPGSYVFWNTGVPATSALWRTLTGTAWTQAVTTPDIVANSITGALIQSAAIATNHFAAQEVFVGSNLPGYGPTRFRVNDQSNNMLALIGDVTTNEFIAGVGTVTSGFKGAYFDNIRVGSGLNKPFLYADKTQVAMGPNITPGGSFIPNVLINASGVFLQNTPLTITNTNGVAVQTNSVNTYLNNQALPNISGYWGFVTQDPGQNNGVIISTTQLFLVRKETAGQFFGQQRQKIVLDAAGAKNSIIYLYDNDRNSAPLFQGPKLVFDSGAVDDFQVVGPALIKAHDGTALRTGFTGNIGYTWAGATWVMKFAAGILWTWGPQLTREESESGMVEPPDWGEGIEKRIAALEAAIGRDNEPEKD